MTAPAAEVAGSDASRVLVAVYALFAVAAASRSGYQIATGFGEAPVAFVLSALAAVVYVVACLALARGRWRLATACCAVELVGVLAVGVWSVADASAFPRATVWSGFGSGYGYVPLVLPLVGLGYLVRRSRRVGHLA